MISAWFGQVVNDRILYRRSSPRYSNALQAASAQGHKELVQLLLEKGADVSAQGGHYLERPEF